MTHGEADILRPGIYNGEENVTRSAGAVFYIEDTSQFMFFLRDNIDKIPCPNMVDIIGGGIKPGEEAEAAARREFAEELFDLDTGQPFRPPELTSFLHEVSYNGVEQNLFISRLPSRPNLRLDEGQKLVFLTKEEITRTDFAFGYRDYALRVAEEVEQEIRDDHFYIPEEDTTALNKVVYPLGYFGVQVAFASKWAELTGEDFAQSLAQRTALLRVMLDTKSPNEAHRRVWQEITSELTIEQNAHDIARLLFDTYKTMPHSAYADISLPFNTFTYDYRPHLPGVQFHLNNPRRGENPFSAENSQLRRQELKQMLQDIQQRHPDAERYVGGNWLFCIPGFRNLFPPNLQLTPPPTLSLNGDSIWGQFVNRHGHTQQRVRRQFLRATRQVQTTQELVGAFPLEVLFHDDPLEDMYEFYNINPNL